MLWARRELQGQWGEVGYVKELVHGRKLKEEAASGPNAPATFSLMVFQVSKRMWNSASCQLLTF